MNKIHAAADAMADVDLNLVVAFDALARERSVTRAAERVGVTQSAMSHTLRRLRELIGDPLLVRGQGGMRLTPRAESLVVPLRSALVTLKRALSQPSAFEPRSTERAFCLASPDLFDVLVLPPMLERVRRDAPGIDLTVVAVEDRRIADRLETGEVDVAITAEVDGSPIGIGRRIAPGLVRQTLFRDRFLCLVRADHPATRGRRRLSLATYAALSHALVSPSGEGPGFVDERLAEHGLERRVALRLPQFYSALAIVAKSDLVLTAPAALARVVPPDLPVLSLEPPLRLPGHAVHMVWHERFSKDPGHRWLRGLVADVARRSMGISREATK